MQHQQVDPPAALKTLIEGFWYLRKDFGEVPSYLEVLPDGHAELIFYFGSGCRIATPEGWQPLPSPFLVGLLQQPVQIQAQNQVEIIGIRCFLGTVFELLGLPAGQGVRGVEHPIAHLQALLQASLRAGRLDEALAQLSRYFEQAQSRMTSDGLFGKASGALQATNGTLPVNQLAAAAAATVRTLERKFKQSAGYTAKDISGRLRFERALHCLWLQPKANLAVLAQELGYADQSHFGREFKRYSRTTPAAFARKANRWHQTGGTDFVAFLLA